ncbi:hypothetical protein FQ087_10470 [Sporosarcina sp. ANT_H38]|uniref:hypothetical protein n=1 Tax=Sporosarcina sp. ANT_H38 TaxID=2597358 RepID=UPI0011F23DF8|nr:hypothetical protein [Sporosarcina sp. ANT_H38]KAA0966622.1 hypothetical protein FQ087_10470 [Sporosarcina sp. ANT_H38]
MKFIVRTMVLLLIVNSLLIYMHYYQAEGANGHELDIATFTQEIEVVNRPEGLHIRQHFSGLSNVRHEIVWPKDSINRSCYLVDATSCNRLDENSIAFLEGENDRQSISYVIPKEGLMKQTALYREPFAGLHGSSASYTLFHMTDETGIGGLWVNGLKRVGAKKMTNINYALFRGEGEVKDLYWQRTNLPVLYAGDRLSVYGAGSNTAGLEEVDSALKAIDANHSTIVVDATNPSVNATRFIVSKNADVDKVSDRFLRGSMYARFTIPEKERMTAELVASILGGKPIGMEKSRKAYKMLTESITVEELKQFKKMLNDSSGQEVNASVLDSLAGEVTGFKTSYFTKNIYDATAFHPFLIEDPRETKFEGASTTGVQLILKDGKTLYPAKKILNLAGYTIKSNDRSIYIENGTRKFRFPKKELFYVYNEKKYDVVTMPFEILEGDLYFEESWFKRLFLLSIEKTANTIDIVRMSALIEEVDK